MSKDVIRAGYKDLYLPSHPFSSKDGYIAEHRVVAEAKIGRYLSKGEIVHHIDENKLNNNPENLVVFRSISDHRRFHQTGRILDVNDGTSVS